MDTEYQNCLCISTAGFQITHLELLISKGDSVTYMTPAIEAMQLAWILVLPAYMQDEEESQIADMWAGMGSSQPDGTKCASAGVEAVASHHDSQNFDSIGKQEQTCVKITGEPKVQDILPY